MLNQLLYLKDATLKTWLLKKEEGDPIPHIKKKKLLGLQSSPNLRIANRIKSVFESSKYHCIKGKKNMHHRNKVVPIAKS
jgi:hypothetical protein